MFYFNLILWTKKPYLQLFITNYVIYVYQIVVGYQEETGT